MNGDDGDTEIGGDNDDNTGGDDNDAADDDATADTVGSSAVWGPLKEIMSK